ncbi:MAG: hypothetical protein FWG12_05445 [Holophagaceae bacterium]|nr:hypothetical protein [Holophagaceae bacterium]
MNIRDGNILNKIQEEARFIIKTTEALDFQSFCDNELVRKAVCMTFINIGEKINLLSQEFLTAYNSVP